MDTMGNAPAATSLIALSGDWLSTDATITTTTGFDNFTGELWNPTYYPSTWWPHYCYVYAGCGCHEKRPIKLTLSEVEHLRMKAKRDKKLRETLQKFTDYIEIMVDFE